MAFPSLGSLFQVGVPMLANRYQGQLQGQELLRKRQLEEEDRARQAQMDALQQQLLQANINKTVNPPKPWEAAGFDGQEEQLGYLEQLQRIQNPHLPDWQSEGYASEEDYLGYLGRKKEVERDDRTPWEEAGFQDEASYISYLERAGKAQYPERHDGVTGSAQSPEMKRDGFLWNYLMQTGKVQDNPFTPDVVEGPPPPEERIREGVKAWNELQKLMDPNYNPADDLPALPAEGWHPPMAPDADPADFADPEHAFPAIESMDTVPEVAEARPIPTPAVVPSAPSRPPADSVLRSAPARAGGQSAGAFSPMQRMAEQLLRGRIAQLKASGISKEEGLRILQQEGYLDRDGNLVLEPSEAAAW